MKLWIDRSNDKYNYKFYQEGMGAYKSGKTKLDNPYVSGTVEHKYWLMGFKDAPWQCL
jgi:hypothetical protein